MSDREAIHVASHKRVTLADVARVAGLAESTVSLAINRPPEKCRLGRATRERALLAAAKLNYRPNWRARALASQKTYTVAMMYGRSSPYLTGTNEAVVDALANTFSGVGYHQLLVPIGPSAPSWIDAVRSDRVDGGIVLAPMPDELDRIHRETGLPLVLVNLKSDRLPLSQVYPDDELAGYIMAKHLLELGHHRIVFWRRATTMPNTPVEHHSVAERIAGYRRAMIEAGYSNMVTVVEHLVEPDMAQWVLAHRHEVTAVVAYDHFHALTLIHHLGEIGIQVPRDLSLGTFNDNALIKIIKPALSTVALPDHEMGRHAAQLLLAQIDDTSLLPRTIKLTPTLRVRSSTISLSNRT